MSTLIRPSHFHRLLNKDAPSLLNSNHHLPLCFKDTLKFLKQAAETKNLNLGKAIHAHLIISNQASQYHVTESNSLINLYSKCGELGSARQLFDKMRKRNVVSWSAFMAGFSQNGFVSEVLRLFKSMVSEDGLCPNEYIFAMVFSSCSDGGYLKLGRQCHGYVLKTGLVFHQYVKNALLRLYSMCLDVGGAMQVLDFVPGSDTCTYNLILDGFIEHGYLSEASNILGRMLAEYVVWNKATYITVCGLCARLKDLNLGLPIHNRLLKSGFEFDLFISSAIIDMYGKCNDILAARKVFDELETRNVVSWTAMLSVYSQNGSFEKALQLFLDMQLEDNIVPNEYTFSVLLNASAGLSAVGYGNSMHAHAEKLGFKSHKNVGDALINMYSKTGDIESAKKVFVEMTYRDCITWNTMICGYSHHGLGKKALAVFQDMLLAEENPNYVTFIGVLTACGHLGQVQEGFYYLHELMKVKGIEPGLEHYTCIVGLLSKAGLLNEALNFMRSTPIKWDVVAWRTLLSACHVHRDYALGKKVAEIILHLDHDDVGTYTLLSNMHAKASKWDGVEKIRKLMRERNIKKEPGLSWVEIKNHTHVFVSDDKQHPESIQIHEKLKELWAKIKPLGYVPDTANVVHDVEDEQKEDYLSYHSEKLAIAYALLKTHAKAPIRIIKNLRMCDDCHSAMKLISKVTKRVITVRDVNRFHCFEDGCCSCADYW